MEDRRKPKNLTAPVRDLTGVVNMQYCHHHDTYEVVVEGAPHCFECKHQFKSGDDLIYQEVEWRRLLDCSTIEPPKLEEIYSCPFCAHGFPNIGEWVK